MEVPLSADGEYITDDSLKRLQSRLFISVPVVLQLLLSLEMVFVKVEVPKCSLELIPLGLGMRSLVNVN